MDSGSGRQSQFVCYGFNAVKDTKRSIISRREFMRYLSVLERVLPVRLELEVYIIANLELSGGSMGVLVLFHPILSSH